MLGQSVFFVSLAGCVAMLAEWRGAPYGLWSLGMLVSWFLVRLYFKTQTCGEAASSRRDLGENITIALTGIGSFFLPLLTFATPVLDFAAYPVTILQIAAGIVETVLGLWLFWRAHADLGTNWSETLETRADHVLVTTGIYRSMRHPMYSAFLCFGIAQMFLLNNWLAGPAGLVGSVIGFGMRIGREERMMAETFGTAWHEYTKRTGRSWPRLRQS